MQPLPCSNMCGRAARTNIAVPITFTRRVRSHKALSLLRISPSTSTDCKSATLANRPSSRPKCATAESTRVVIVASSDWSKYQAMASKPAAFNSSTKPSAAAILKSPTPTRAPSSHKRRTVAAPIPVAPPQTKMCFPCRFFIMWSPKTSFAALLCDRRI